MRIQLSDHFTYGKLLRFVFPAIVTMIFTSVYSIIDGLFVSNFVGNTSFAALNLIFPLIMVLGAVGFMIGSGGSATIFFHARYYNIPVWYRFLRYRLIIHPANCN